MIVLNMSLGVRNCTGYQKVPIAICVQISLRNGMTLGSRTCLRSNANQVPLLGKNFFTSHAPGRKMGLNIFSATNLQCQLFNVHPSYLLYLFICCVKKEPRTRQFLLLADFLLCRKSINFFTAIVAAGVVQKLTQHATAKIPTTCVICEENLQSYHRSRVSISSRLQGTGQNCGLVSIDRNQPVSTGFYKGTLVSFLVLDAKKVLYQYLEVYILIKMHKLNCKWAQMC